MRLAKLCLAATLLHVSTAALAGDLSHSTPEQAFAALGTSRDPAVIYKEAASQGWTVSRANSGGLNLSGRLTDGTYVFDRLDPADYWKPNKSPPQANSDNSNIVFRKWENHEHRVSVPGTSTDVVTNPDGTLDYNNRGADVTSYWIIDKGKDKGKIVPTTDPRESHMPIDGNPADVEIPNFVRNGSTYDNPPSNPNNLPVPTDPNANLPVPVEKPPANTATNQTPPETPPSSGLRQGVRNVAEGSIVNAFTTYWTCIQANPDQQAQCAKASGISTAIGAGCSTAQEATGSATVGFACNALIGYKACVLSGRDPNQCLTDWQSGIPPAAFCAAVGLLNVAAGMICGAVAPSAYEAGLAIIEAGNAQRINGVMGPIVNRALTCQFGAALSMAMRDFTNPPRGLPTVDEKLVRILEADLLAERNVQKLLGKAEEATDPQQRQTLLDQALAAAGSIRCLRGRVTALMPPASPRPPKVPPSVPPNKPPTIPANTPSSPKACTPYACNYMDPTLGGAAQSGVYEMDVCVPASGDWSAATCTIDSITYAHAVAGQANPDSRTTCGPRPFFGIIKDHASFVQQCKSLNGRVTEPQAATQHAEIAHPPSQPDTGIASAPKQQEQPPDTGIASAAEPTHPQQPQGPQIGLPNPTLPPGSGPGPAPGPGSTSNGGGPSINIFIPPPPGPMPGGGHTPNGPPPGDGHPANGAPPAPIPGPPPGPEGAASSGPPPVPSPGPPKQPPGQPGSGGRISGGTCNADGTCVDNAGHPVAPLPNPGDPKPGLGSSPGPATPATPGTKQKTAALPVQKVEPKPQQLPVQKVEPKPQQLPVQKVEPKPQQLPVQKVEPRPDLMPVQKVEPKPAPAPPAAPRQPANAGSPPPPAPALPQQEAKVAPPPVQPDCLKPHVVFYTDRNESITTQETSIGGGACVHSFNATGNATLTHASPISQPSNGALTQLGAFKFQYQPNNGFTGSDQYTIEVCGDGPNGAGCSRLTWQTTVE